MAQSQVTLLDDERELGRYTVVVLVRVGERWQPTLMPLTALVTNYRLILRPHRRKYEPASLPNYFFGKITMQRLDNYHCLQVKFINGDRLHLMLSTGNLDDLYSDLLAMRRRAPRFRFDGNVPRLAIQRLTRYLESQRHTTELPAVSQESASSG